MNDPPNDVDYSNLDSVKETMLKDAKHLWWSKLYMLDQRWSMGVNFTHWDKTGVMPLPYRWKRGLQLMNTQAAVHAGLATEQVLRVLIES